MNVLRTSFLALIFCIISVVQSARALEEVDLELVLAMDASGSISEAEYLLQVTGTANAFLDPSIQAAILSGPLGRIAVSVLLWSDAAFPKYKSGWFVLEDVASITAFAEVVRTFRIEPGNRLNIGGGGGTGIGEGVAEALRMISGNEYSGLRKTIDVSGDGIETEYWFPTNTMKMPKAKELARDLNVTVNGLPILSPNSENLDTYYAENVITGPGSFVIAAKSFDDFARAIREKLWREISHPIS